MKSFKILIILFLPFILTGCWDKVELEDRGLVLTIGIDKYSNDDETPYNGEKNLYTVSMDIPDISSISNSSQESALNEGENSKENKNPSVLTASGQSVYSTMKLIDSYSSQNLYYGHTKVAILGEDLIKDENYLKEVIDSLERNQEISRKLIILATKNKAKDILNLNYNGTKNLGLFINDFYKDNLYNAKFTFRQDLEGVIQDLLSVGDTIIPEIEIENRQIKISGLAIIKDYKLVCWFDEDMTKSFLWFNKTKNVGNNLEVKFENVFIPLKITKNKVKMSLEEIDKNILCNIFISIEGNIGEYSLNENLFIDTNKYEILENKYKEKIRNDILVILNFIQNELKVDILGLNEFCRKNYNDIYKKFDFVNKDIFESTLFNVNVDVKIDGSGSIK